MPVYVENIRDAVKQFHDDTGEYVNSFSQIPEDDSPAGRQLSIWEGEEIRTAFAQGSLLLESTAEHMVSTARLLEEPIQTVSPWTCARGSLESAAFGCWLMDPTIDARQRAGRTFAFRFEGVNEQLKVARLAGSDAAVKRGEARLQSIEDRATELGFGLLRDGRARRIGIAVRMPSATGCIAQELGMEFEYRVFSSVAHSQPGAISMLAFEATDLGEPTLLEKSLSPAAATFIMARSAQALHRIVRTRATFMGHDTTALDAAVERVCGTLPPGAATEMRGCRAS